MGEPTGQVPQTLTADGRTHSVGAVVGRTVAGRSVPRVLGLNECEAA